MFRCFPTTALGIVTLALLCGCGTVSNFTDSLPDQSHYGTIPWGLYVPAGGRQIYGGSRSDLWGFYCLTTPSDPVIFFVGAFTVAVDLPLSLVGDTVTLPWTISATASRLADVQVPSQDTKRSATTFSSDNSR